MIPPPSLKYGSGVAGGMHMSHVEVLLKPRIWGPAPGFPTHQAQKCAFPNSQVILRRLSTNHTLRATRLGYTEVKQKKTQKFVWLSTLLLKMWSRNSITADTEPPTLPLNLLNQHLHLNRFSGGCGTVTSRRPAPRAQPIAVLWKAGGHLTLTSASWPPRLGERRVGSLPWPIRNSTHKPSNHSDFY